MKIKKFAAIGAGLALVGGLLVAPSATASAPAAATSLAATAVPKVIATRKVDVSGDGRSDTVTVTEIATDRYKIEVKTPKGSVASFTLTSTIKANWGLANPLRGAANIDGAKGAELLVYTSGGDGLVTTVLTWRDKQLVREAAPLPHQTTDKRSWTTLAVSWGRIGYRFLTKNGQRYAVTSELLKDGAKWNGTVVASRWTLAKGWTKVSAKNVSLTKAQALKYPGDFVDVKITATK